MEIQECLDLLREVKDVAFATVDHHGRPQNRIIDIMIAENERIYFCTARGKDFYQQLNSDGHVAITGMNKKYQMVCLRGKAIQLMEQKKWIDRIFQENPSMNLIYPGENRYILEPFCVEPEEVEFFDVGSEPIHRETVCGLQTKGFVIASTCIGCNTCAENCPQKCITAGTPYMIVQEHCLHCGLCYENCPVKAVRRRGE